MSQVDTKPLYFCSDKPLEVVELLNFIAMEVQIQQPKSIVFTEQRIFTLGDERFKQSLPLIESDYSKIMEGCEASPVSEILPESECGDTAQSTRAMEVFFKNAYRLFAKRDVILSDSRLSRAQLPFSRVFEGTATLGEYLVWWQNYRCSQIEEEQGEHYLIYNYFFKSSVCHYVDREGRTFSADIGSSVALRASFAEARSLLKSCSIYTSEREICTLEQVVEILDVLS